MRTIHALVSVVAVVILALLLSMGHLARAGQAPAGEPTVASFLPVALRPFPTPTSVPNSVLLNGDFEQGPAYWTEYSSNGWPLILTSANMPLTPHSGGWAAWLGGDVNELSVLSQIVTIVPGDALLHFWYWIASEDICNPDYDIAGVVINDTAVDAWLLCEDENTGGWVRRSVNLGAYAGQSVNLQLVASTDDVLNSNLFIDDVSLDPTLLPATPRLEAPQTGHLALKSAGGNDAPVVTDPGLLALYRSQLHELLRERVDWPVK